jgi:hypothetical protein
MITKMEAIPIETGQSIYFETKNINGKIYEQRIEVSEREIIIWNCTCEFGSAFRFSKENLEKDKKCRHISEAIELLKYLEYIKYI